MGSHTCIELTRISFIQPASQALQNETDWFDPKLYLGKRGFKYFPRPAQLWLASCNKVLENEILDSETTGVVMGTHFGINSVLNRLDKMILTEGVNGLSPMESPNFCVNLIPSISAIKLGLHRFNATVTTPGSAAFDALWLAAENIMQNKCETVLCGAVESNTLEESARDHSINEGAVALLLKSSQLDTSQGIFFSGFVELHIPQWDLALKPIDKQASSLIGQAQRKEVHSLFDNATNLQIISPSEQVGLWAQQLVEKSWGKKITSIDYSIPEQTGALDGMNALNQSIGCGHESCIFVYASPQGALRIMHIAVNSSAAASANN